MPFAPFGYGFQTGAIDAETTFAPKAYRAGTQRMQPENLPHTKGLVELVWACTKRKSAVLGQVALAWLMAQAPWIMPIPGSTQMPHMVENGGGAPLRGENSGKLACRS